MQQIKSIRDTLLRPLQVITGIVERRQMPVLPGYMIRADVARSEKQRLHSKARTKPTAELDTDGNADGQQAQCESVSGSDDGDGDGDGDPDSDRPRHLPSSYSTSYPSSPTFLAPQSALEASPSSPSRCTPYYAALLVVSLLSLIYLGMIVLFAHIGRDELIPPMLAGFFGFAALVRCFVKPK